MLYYPPHTCADSLKIKGITYFPSSLHYNINKYYIIIFHKINTFLDFVV